MTKGTYTVTAKEGEKETSGSEEVVAQYVKEIKVLNSVALTGIKKNGAADGTDLESGECYVYYDVLDQYGESLKNSTTVEWSTSAVKDSDRKADGKLTLSRSDKKAFTYGEQIYITGVYAKTGVSTTATLTVGAKQSLNSVEVAGFVKKGTNTLLSSLPSGFKVGAYYLAFSVLDQNGNAMTADNDYVTAPNNDVTFVSDNVLVLKEITASATYPETDVNIDGVDYNAVPVTPGQNVDKGGEVTITAIANKTGNKTEMKVVVGDAQILKSFTMSAPTGIIADGETVNIPFTALDQNGKPITSFTTLASQSDFSNLTLNASEGWLRLVENNDGTASLKWSDSKTLWESDSEDGIDRPISLTSVVVGGDTSNMMIYVSDKAMPDSIKDVNMASVIVEGGAEKINLSDFTFLDQYGREIGGYGYNEMNNRWENPNKGYVKDNGFFKDQGVLSGTDFTGYTYGVQVEYKGATKYLDTPVHAGANTINNTTTSAILYHEAQVANGYTITTTGGAVTASTDDQTVRFTIVKKKAGKDAEETSTAKNKSFRIVNIDKISGFAIKNLNTLHVQTAATSSDTLKLYNSNVDIQDKLVTPTIPAAYQQEVKVTGKFGDVTVDIPAAYYTVVGNKVGVQKSGDAITPGALGTIKLDEVSTVVPGSTTRSAFVWKDLYDATSANYVRKEATDTITATIYNLYGAKANTVKDVATKQITIADATPSAKTIKADDAYTYLPDTTKIGLTGMNLNCQVSVGDNNNNLSWVDAHDFIGKYDVGGFKVVDQYGVDVTTNVTDWKYKISDPVENAAGYAENNFAVTGNDTAAASIVGAELGDQFTLIVSATYNGTVTKNIKVTVGADAQSNITNGTNNYKDNLVDIANGLEDQRKAGLGN